MQTRKIFCLPAILGAFLYLACPTPSRAQLSDVPVKAGLWQTQVSVNSSPAVSAQSCFTSGTKLADYLTASNRGAPGVQCSVTNKTQTAHSVSFDTSCTSAQLASTGHIAIQSQDADHFTGSSHTEVAGKVQGSAVKMTLDKRFTGKFLSADCGSVKPMVTAPGK